MSRLETPKTAKERSGCRHAVQLLKPRRLNVLMIPRSAMKMARRELSALVRCKSDTFFMFSAASSLFVGLEMATLRLCNRNQAQRRVLRL